MDREEDDTGARDRAGDSTYQSPARAANEATPPAARDVNEATRPPARDVNVSTQAPRRHAEPLGATVPDGPAGRISRPLSEAMRSVFDVPRQRFDEVAELGRGGMGRVVEAVDRTLSRTVAIKHMLETDSAGLARFEREVRITARLQHPGIVPVLDVGRDEDGQPYYVMRKIEGKPLADRVKAAGSVRDRLALVPAVLGAVDACAYAHAQGVVHRDIKPWNILLGSFGETLLIDWGLARELGTSEDIPVSQPGAAAAAADDGLTRMGHAYGTPGYMAPEQARGEPADRRADVYSLGATLYYVLTGTSPFGDSGATLAIQRASLGERPDLARLPEEVPVELSAILSKALSPGRTERYADAGELAEDLRRFLAGQLVAAHHYTLPQLVARWLRRHLLVTSISVLAVAVVAVVGTYAVRRVVSERDEARAARTLAEGRAEELLVDRARSLVTVDPTGAAALLRALPPSSPRWPVAAEVVRAAVGAGVERAVKVGDANVNCLAISPSGVLASLDALGDLRVHEPTTFKPRLVLRLDGSRITWLDDDTLLAINWTYGDHPNTIEVVDVRSDRVVQRYPGQVSTYERVFGAVYVRMEDGRVVAFEKGGAMREVATHTLAMNVSEDWLVLAFHDGVDRISHTGERFHIPLDVTSKVWGVAVSRSGQRVAVWSDLTVVEFDLNARTTMAYDTPRSSLEFFSYVGERLFVGPTSGGALAVTDRLVSQQWFARGKPFPLARFDGGAFVATESGGVGVIDAELGVLPMIRRMAAIRSIAVEPRGEWAAIGTTDGVLQIVPLTPVRPRVREVPGSLLLAADDDHIILSAEDSSGGAPYHVVDTKTLEIHSFGVAGFAPDVVLDGDRVVIGTTGLGAEVSLSTLDGKTLWRTATSVWSTGTGLDGGRSVFYATPAGDVLEHRIDIEAPDHLVAHFEPVRQGDDRTMPPVLGLFSQASSLIASIAVKTQDEITWKVMVIDRTGARELDFGMRVAPGFVTRAADGAWWFVSENLQLFRAVPGQVPRPVPFSERIRAIFNLDGEIWIVGLNALYRYTPSGTLLGTTQFANSHWVLFKDRVAAIGAYGVEVIRPQLNTRLMHAVAETPGAIVANDSATMLATTIVRGGRTLLAVWRDPVPTDPAQVPAYLERITNARLMMSSDAVTWDP